MGLLGVCGISSDLRTLEASPEHGAKSAMDPLVYRIGCELGSLTAALGGLDAIAFTAGIGEHSASLRQRVCRDASWRGRPGSERAPRDAHQHRLKLRLGDGRGSSRD